MQEEIHVQELQKNKEKKEKIKCYEKKDISGPVQHQAKYNPIYLLLFPTESSNVDYSKINYGLQIPPDDFYVQLR